jgi:protein-disulfide isomerase
MNERLEGVLSAVLVLVALAVATTFVHREFFAGPRDTASVVAQPPQRVDNWKELLDNSVVLGDPAAQVTLVELADLECPFCKRLNESVLSIRRRFGHRVAFGFVHFPLDMHRFARPAARAAECANALGRFEQFVNVVYDKQDSLGLKTWLSYARDAGIRDTNRFQRCVGATTPVPRIEAGVALARRMGARGTPTVILNGWRYFTPPDEKELERAVLAVLAGKEPFTSRR